MLVNQWGSVNAGLNISILMSSVFSANSYSGRCWLDYRINHKRKLARHVDAHFVYS
jgi:hypothetical protein